MKEANQKPRGWSWLKLSWPISSITILGQPEGFVDLKVQSMGRLKTNSSFPLVHRLNHAWHSRLRLFFYLRETLLQASSNNPVRPHLIGILAHQVHSSQHGQLSMRNVTAHWDGEWAPCYFRHGLILKQNKMNKNANRFYKNIYS